MQKKLTKYHFNVYLPILCFFFYVYREKYPEVSYSRPMLYDSSLRQNIHTITIILDKLLVHILI